MLRGQQVAYTLCTQQVAYTLCTQLQGTKPRWQGQHIMALQACLVCMAAGNRQQSFPAISTQAL